MDTSCVRAQTALALVQIYSYWREKKARTYLLAPKISLKSNKNHSQTCMPCCSFPAHMSAGKSASSWQKKDHFWF